MDVEMDDVSTRVKDESQSSVNTGALSGYTTTVSNKPCQNLVKCNCVDLSSEEGHSSDAKSVGSNPISEASYVVVSDPSLPTNRICCLKQRFGSIFNSEDSNDVSFVVGRGEQKLRIPAHKLVLSVGSVIFKTMFSQNWSAESAEIEILDVEPQAFLVLLRFLYTDEVELTSESVVGILYAARKYDVKPLENSCVKFLTDNLCPENAFTILNEAILLDIQSLISASLEKIDRDTISAVAADAFCDMTIKTLCLLLERNTLKISEIKLFEAILRWSEAECLRENLCINQENQRLVLKEVLPLIRFPLMSVEEVTSKVVPSGLLSKDELLSVILYLTTKPRPPITLNKTPRSYKEVIVNRFQKLESGCPCTGKRNQINFTCDQDVRLLGYGLFGSADGPATYEVFLELEETLTNISLDYEYIYYESNDPSLIYRALFENSIKLSAFKQYTARVKVEGPDCYMGKKGLKDVTVDLSHGRKLTVTFSTFIDEKSPNLKTNVEQGFIPQLIFEV